MKKIRAVFILILALLAGGCGAKKQISEFALTKLSPSEYPDFRDDMAYSGLEECISQSLKYLGRIPKDRVFEFGKDTFSAAHIIRSLEHFRNFIAAKPSAQDLKKFIASYYIVYKSAGDEKKAQVLFTGYYEPMLEGSLNEHDEYRFPVYSCPDDLMTIDLSLFSPEFKGKKITGRIFEQTFIPYYDRKEIEQGQVLKGKAKVIAWVKDRVDLFFLQIQGSGKIRLDKGEIINVHYHSKNGHPYQSIGKVLIESEKIPKAEMSMQKIREYLAKHPEEVETVLNANPSYIFFSKEEEGPLGAINVVLTPGRSLAVDKKMYPLSALAFIETQKPIADASGEILNWSDCPRFVLNQDTGGAIKGRARADLFWGSGHYAEIAAGHLQHRGNLYMLVLKPDMFQ